MYVNIVSHNIVGLISSHSFVVDSLKFSTYQIMSPVNEYSFLLLPFSCRYYLFVCLLPDILICSGCYKKIAINLVA